MTSPSSVAELAAAIDRGERPKYVFFWGHTPGAPGIVGKECLSQWYPSPFEVDGVIYATAEHYMMAEKARLFGDDDALARILSVEHPGAAKRSGREVKRFEESTWQSARIEVALRGNGAKFEQHKALRALLLRTGERVLVEASPIDPIWGIGLAATDERVMHPLRWPGENLLGFALMEVRNRLVQ